MQKYDEILNFVNYKNKIYGIDMPYKNKNLYKYEIEYETDEEEYGYGRPLYAPLPMDPHQAEVAKLERQLSREQDRNAMLEGALHFERKAARKAEEHVTDRLRGMAHEVKRLQAEIDRRRAEDEDRERRKTEGARDFKGRAQRVRSIDLGDNDE